MIIIIIIIITTSIRISIDYCYMFCIFLYRKYYSMYDKVELKEGPLKCYSLGVTTRSYLTLTEGNHEQDRQCTYNVTMRRVFVTIVAVEKQTLLHILSVCLYP